MQGPVGSASYGPPRVDPSFLRHNPLFSASVMFGERTPENGLGIGTPKWDTALETVEIDMSSLPAAATLDTRAANATLVDEEALRSSARRDRSSGGADDPWVPDPWSGIWTLRGPSVGEPREDIEIKGVYSQSRGKGSSGGIRLRSVIASDVGDAVRLEDLQALSFLYYEAKGTNLDNFILDWEDFAEEVVVDMLRDMPDKWACHTFPHRRAPNLRRIYVIQFVRRGSIRRNNVSIGSSRKKELMLQTKRRHGLWSIPLNLERGDLRLMDWRRYLRKCRRLLKQVSKRKMCQNQARFAVSCEVYCHWIGRNVWTTKKRSGQRSAWQYALCRRKISIFEARNISGETWESRTG